MNMKELQIQRWLKIQCEKRANNTINRVVPLFDILKCKDGTELAVQASADHLCYPQITLRNGNYIAVSVSTLGNDLGLPKDYEIANCVYGNIPIDMLQELIDKHGGIVEEQLKDGREEESSWTKEMVKGK